MRPISASAAWSFQHIPIEKLIVHQYISTSVHMYWNRRGGIRSCLPNQRLKLHLNWMTADISKLYTIPGLQGWRPSQLLPSPPCPPSYPQR